MGPIEYAIEEVKARIPPQLLKLVFTSTGQFFAHNPGAVEAAIREKVVDARVRRVVDTAGATQDDIPLFGLTFVPVTESNSHRSSQTVFIPKDRTQGRTISSAISLVFGTTAAALAYGHPSNSPTMATGANGSSVLLDAAIGVLNSAVPQGPIQSANVSLVGENVVLIEDYIPQGTNIFLRCILKADDEFSHVRPATYQAFSELVVLATKAYIYNNYYIELGRGFLMGGMELPQIQNLVDEYRDADSLFLEYLKEKWYKISAMNDPTRKSRHLKMMIGGQV